MYKVNKAEDFTSYAIKQFDGSYQTIHCKNNKLMDNKPVATKEQIDALDIMNSVAIDAQHIINKLKTAFPHPKGSREKSLVVTKLEEAIFWTKFDIELNHQLPSQREATAVPMYNIDNSATITYVGWKEDILYIKLRNGSTFKYFNVPIICLHKLIASEDPDVYMETDINHFKCVKL